MASAYVVRAVSDDSSEAERKGLYASLEKGKARIGWSYEDALDLRKIRTKVNRGEKLNEEERSAWRGQGFLEYITPGDYLVCPNLPEYGKFCIVQISPESGDYMYSPREDSIAGDFRSYRPCELLPPGPIDKNDRIVPPIIRSRLGLPGRFFRLYDWDDFNTLLNNLSEVGKKESGADDRLERILGELRKRVPQLVHHEFPRHDLSRIFCKELFDRMGYHPDITEGSHDKGSNLIVTIPNPLMDDEFRVGIQVFSYEGQVSLDDVKRKLGELLLGWEVNALDFGVLLTTGQSSPCGLEQVREHNRAHPDRKVKVIDGEHLADLFLRYFNTVPFSKTV